MSVGSYRDDPLYPRLFRAVEPLLERGKVVAPVDVLVGMGLLDPAKLEDWRFGRGPYLEKVIDCNLTRLSRLLRILRLILRDLPGINHWVTAGKPARLAASGGRRTS